MMGGGCMIVSVLLGLGNRMIPEPWGWWRAVTLLLPERVVNK